MTGTENITRFEHGRTLGFCVRIYRTEKGERRCHSKLFSDGVWGGKRKALAAAKAWRDRLLRKLVPVGSNRFRVAPGHGYVKLYTRERVGGPSSVFVAWIRVRAGRCKSTSRSVAIWGWAGAQRECEAWLRRERKALKR